MLPYEIICHIGWFADKKTLCNLRAMNSIYRNICLAKYIFDEHRYCVENNLVDRVSFLLQTKSIMTIKNNIYKTTQSPLTANGKIKLFLEKHKIIIIFISITLCLASQKGNLEIVEFIIVDTKIDPAIMNNAAIRLAAQNGRIDVVKLLLADPRVNPADVDNYAIRFASQNGHADIVKLLLTDPRVDPTVIN